MKLRTWEEPRGKERMMTMHDDWSLMVALVGLIAFVAAALL